MKETSILYSSDMVRAYLQGKKTMTRRTTGLSSINDPPQRDSGWQLVAVFQDGCARFTTPDGNGDITLQCPYGGYGDKLWGKETWGIFNFSANLAEKRRLQVAYKAGVKDINHPEGMTYDLEWRTVDYETWQKYTQQKYCRTWHSGRFMPRFASRITQTITDIRVERLQDITEEGAQAEGMNFDEHYQFGRDYGTNTCRELFQRYWDTLSRKRGYPFSSNCWVWVISYPAYKKTK